MDNKDEDFVFSKEFRESPYLDQWRDYQLGSQEGLPIGLLEALMKASGMNDSEIDKVFEEVLGDKEDKMDKRK